MMYNTLHLCNIVVQDKLFQAMRQSESSPWAPAKIDAVSNIVLLKYLP